jgi:hypothetical protein
MEPTLHGKPAIKVNAARVTWGSTSKSKLYNIDGDKEWIPNSLCEFTPDSDSNTVGDTPGTLVVVEWKYNQMFPNG